MKCWKILPYLKSNELGCHNFMNTAKNTHTRMRFLDQTQRPLLLWHSKQLGHQHLHHLLLLPGCRIRHRWTQKEAYTQLVAFQDRNSEYRVRESFTMSNKHAWLCSRIDTLFPKAVCYINILVKIVQNKKQSMPSSQDMQKWKRPMQICPLGFGNVYIREVLCLSIILLGKQFPEDVLSYDLSLEFKFNANDNMPFL